MVDHVHLGPKSIFYGQVQSTQLDILGLVLGQNVFIDDPCDRSIIIGRSFCALMERAHASLQQCL
jgi:hypothetical protein